MSNQVKLSMGEFGRYTLFGLRPDPNPFCRSYLIRRDSDSPDPADRITVTINRVDDGRFPAIKIEPVSEKTALNNELVFALGGLVVLALCNYQGQKE